MTPFETILIWALVLCYSLFCLMLGSALTLLYIIRRNEEERKDLEALNKQVFLPPPISEDPADDWKYGRN